MAKVVFKYPLNISQGPGPCELQLPIGAELLSIGEQIDNPAVFPKLVLWALVNPDQTVFKPVYLELAWTGTALVRDPVRFIGTARARHLVWHLFEVEPF